MKKDLSKKNNVFINETLAAIGDGVIITDLAGCITYMNGAAEEITGWNLNEAFDQNSKKVLALYDADNHDLLQDPVFSVIKSKTATGLKEGTILITRDGAIKYLSASCSPIISIGQELSGVIIVFRDITKYKQLEMIYQQEETNLRTIFNTSPVAMFLLAEDAVIIQINDAALSLLGRSRDEVINRRFGDALGCKGSLESEFGCGHGRICGSNCELRRSVNLAFEGLTTANIEYPQTFLINSTKNSYWFRASVTPINIDHTTKVSVVLEDITARKHQEIAIAKSHDFYLRIFESFPAIVWQSTFQNECLYVNKTWQEFTGASADKALGNDWFKYIHPEDQQKQPFEDNYNNDIELYEFETRMRHRSGQYRWIYCIRRLSYDLNGLPVGFIGIGIDITDRKIAEDGLNRYKILSEGARDIIVFIDLDGHILEANTAACNTYGYSKEELLSLTIHDLRCYKDSANETITKSFNNSTFFETIHCRKNGTSFPVEVSSQSAEIGGKKVILGIIRDITERKKAEKLIRESEANYRSLFKNMPNLFELVEVIKDDYGVITDFIFLEVNEAWQKTMKYTEDEVVGRRYSEVFPEFYRFIKDACAHSIKERGVVFFQKQEYYSVQMKLWYQVSVYESGEGHLGILTENITSRKLAELGERRSQSRYRSLFMNMHSGFCYGRIILDKNNKGIDFEFLEINDAYEKFIEAKREDVIGNRFSELFPQHSDAYSHQIQLFSDVATEVIDRAEWEYYSDIADKWLHMAVYSPEKNYFVAITTDISERKLAERALQRAKDGAEEAVRTKSEFLANMSHEIRTPINGIMGMVDLTLLTDLDDEQRENLDTAKSCAHSLLRIINDILDFSKMEVGKMIIDNIDFNCFQLIDEIVRTHSLRAAQKGLELSVTMSENIPKTINGDPGRLRQILNNLLDNAIKFTDSGSVVLDIKKTFSKKDSIELSFSVTDTGIGIDNSEMDKLFKTFSQVDGSITRRFGGTGLGLIISKRLVEMMGGRMSVESSKDKGSTFYFTLRVKPAVSDGTCATDTKNNLRRSEPKTILLVEDDPINRTVTTRMLKEMGHKVIAAENGKKALEILEHNLFDVVLMDIQMPVMDGIETTKIIRASEHQTGKHLPIVAVTAHALTGDRERFLAVGMDEYLAKPVQIEDLINMLDNPKLYSPTPSFDSLDHIRINNNGDIIISGKSEEFQDIEKKTIMLIIDKLLKQIETAAAETNIETNIIAIEGLAHRIKELANKIEAEELKSAAFKAELAARRGNLSESINNIVKIKHLVDIYHKSEIIS